MLFSRILGGVGRLMISAGMILLLFVAYQLWGTGLQTSQAQDRLGDDFASQVQAMGAATGVGPTAGPATGEGAASGPAPLSLAELAKDPKVQEYARNKKYVWGEAIGKILIPNIGADFWIVEGAGLDLLTEGPGHFPSTPMPGQAGNSAIAGHRTTFNAPFNRIDELVPGDLVTVETLQGRFTYEVLPQADGTSYRIVGPGAVEILEDKGDNRLTLMACHPKYSAAQRIVVTAKLIDNPVATTEKSTPPPGKTDELAVAQLGADEEALAGEVAALATGNEDARGPAIAYSVGAALLWLAAAAVGWRWRRAKWPAYLVALPLFGFLLWQAFEHINRALPAAY